MNFLVACFVDSIGNTMTKIWTVLIFQIFVDCRMLFCEGFGFVYACSSNSFLLIYDCLQFYFSNLDDYFVT